MVVKKGLGRGFDSLFDVDTIDEQFDVTADIDKNVSVIKELKLSEVVPDPNQARQIFDETALNELAQSIKENGIFTPIVVIEKNGKYEIVAGERRWRASKIAGIETIPAIVRTFDGQQRLQVSIIENMQREDLNDLEKATGLLKLQTEYNMDVTTIAQKVGISQPAASNLLRMLKLPDFAKDALVKKEISGGHARQVLALPTEEKQRELVNLIKNKGISVRAAEEFVVAEKTSKNLDKKIVAAKKIDTPTDFAKKAMDKLGLIVQHKITTKKGGGKVIIEFKNENEFKKIEKLLG